MGSLGSQSTQIRTWGTSACRYYYLINYSLWVFNPVNVLEAANHVRRNANLGCGMQIRGGFKF